MEPQHQPSGSSCVVLCSITNSRVALSAEKLSNTTATNLQLVRRAPEELWRVQHTAQKVYCSLHKATPEARRMAGVPWQILFPCVTGASQHMSTSKGRTPQCVEEYHRSMLRQGTVDVAAAYSTARQTSPQASRASTDHKCACSICCNPQTAYPLDEDLPNALRHLLCCHCNRAVLR
jgi:hypothetical protein